MLAAGVSPLAALCLAVQCTQVSAARIASLSRPPGADSDSALASLVPEVLARAIASLPPVLVHSSGSSRVRIWPPRRVEGQLCGAEDALVGHGAFPAVDEMLLLPSGELLVTTGSDGTSVAWSLGSRNRVATFPRSGERLDLGDSRAFPDGERVLSISRKQEAHAAVVWNATSGGLLRRFNLNGSMGSFLEAGVILPGDRVVTAASHGPDAEFVVWSVSTGRALHSWRHTGMLRCMEVSPCGMKVVTAGINGIFLWDTGTGAQEMHIDAQVCPWRPRAEVSSGGARVYATSSGDISVWEGATGDLRTTVSMILPIDDFALLPDGWRLVAIGRTSAIVWDVERGSLLQTLRGVVAEGHFSFALSATGDAIAICSALQQYSVEGFVDSDRIYRDADLDDDVVVNYTAQIWDVASGRLLHKYNTGILAWARHHRICSVAVSSATQGLVDSLVGRTASVPGSV